VGKEVGKKETRYFLRYGVRPYPEECYKDERQENIFFRWQGLIPHKETVCFLAEKGACLRK
jgi:hypothetical protein